MQITETFTLLGGVHYVKRVFYLTMRTGFRCFIFAVNIVLFTAFAFAQTNVLTYHNDNARTGQNLSETQLTPANVNSASFGKLFNLIVDGKVDAQPLYVSGLSIPGAGVYNVVFVPTEHDSVYAFDAATGNKLWQISVLKPGETTSDARNCGQVIPEIGITATPVIDLKAGPHGTIYLVSMSKDASGNYYQRLHALDLTSGAEEFGGPIDVHATYPGTGENSVNGSVVFDPKQYKERAALLLLNGVVYTSWTSHCDIQPYTGWTIGYDESTLAQTSIFNFAPNGSEASIWDSGAGPASDANGNLYFSVANGTFDTNLNSQGFPSQADYGNSFLKLQLTNGKLQAADYWTMYNTIAESDRDEDLGSGGLLLIPDVQDGSGQIKHLGVGAGKDANVYLFDRDNMGKFNSTNNSNIYQELPNALQGGEYGMPAWFNGTVYFGAVGDSIRAFPLSAGKLSATPSSITSNRFPYPGSIPSVSANGAANGIVWAVESSNAAVLHAYDATNLGTELYNSNQVANGRDQFGAGNKFIAPTIADGKVFVGTQNSVGVFGLFQPPTVSAPAPPAPTPVPVSPSAILLSASPAAITAGTAVVFTATVSSAAGVPGGSVAFSEGTTVLETGSLNANGVAVFSTGALGVGTHSIVAAYSGSAAFAASTSAQASVTVVPAPTAQTSFTVAPVQVLPGVTVGSTTVTWSTPSAGAVEVHVGAPNGPLFTYAGSSGSAQTGNWVTDGEVFFLQDVTNGKSLTPANTLALATAKLSASALQGTLTISPNPISAADGIFGTATLNWNSSSSALVEVRVNAPNGPLFAAGSSQGSATANGWVTNGMTFYLQDVSQGEILTPSYTIATATATVQRTAENGYLLSDANPITVSPGQLLASANLNWNTTTANLVEVHVGSPDGPLFARGGPQGSAAANGWITDGTVFFLQDVSSNQPLTALSTIAAQTIHFSASPSGVSLQASPNPILVLSGAGLGTTTLFWNAPGVSLVELHVGSPAGPLFAQGASQGSAIATGWVREGLVFYLQDVSNGKPLTAANTLATVTAHVLVTAAQ